jgi:hypothetical protein
MGYEDERLGKYSDSNIKTVSKTFTIPIGGGEAYNTYTITDFGFTATIDAVLAVRIIRQVPVVDNVYVPSYAIDSTSTKVGITLAAGTGTTLTAELMAYGS